MTGYAFMVSARTSGEYQHLTARMVALADDGSPRNLATDDTYRVDPFAGIVATAQADRSPERTGEGVACSYGWCVGMTADAGDVIVTDQAIATLATLRKVARSLASAETRYGAPATFGALVARIATALSVPVITGASGSDGMYSTGRWVSWTPGESVRIIDGWTAEHRRTGAA